MKRTLDTASTQPPRRGETGIALRWPLPFVLRVAARCSARYQAHGWRRLSAWWNEEYLSRYCRTALCYHQAHPRDRDVQFREEGHRYWIRGLSLHGYTSVTTFIHHMFGEFDANAAIVAMMDSPKWAGRTEYHGLKPREIKARWEHNRDQAAASGTEMHANIETYYNGAHYETEAPAWRSARALFARQSFEELWLRLLQAFTAYLETLPAAQQQRLERFWRAHCYLDDWFRQLAQRFYAGKPLPKVTKLPHGRHQATVRKLLGELPTGWLTTLCLWLRTALPDWRLEDWPWFATQLEGYFARGTSYETDYREWQLFVQYRAALLEEEELLPWRTEWRLYSEDLGIVGTIDMLYYRRGAPRDPLTGRPLEVVMADWKRSREIKMTNPFQRGRIPGLTDELDDCNYQHYTLQLSLYKLILERHYGLKVVDMFLGVFHPDQTEFLRVPIVYHRERMERLFEYRARQWRVVQATRAAIAGALQQLDDGGAGLEEEARKILVLDALETTALKLLKTA